MAGSRKTFVVEHLDPELEEWSSLEYLTIARECHASGAQFLLSSVSPSLKLPQSLREAKAFRLEVKGIEELYAADKIKVCLLDPAAPKDLSPDDGDIFDVFLFGGILGDDPPQDRTSQLRQKGYQGRRLGPVQMTTDTAVRVTRTVVQDRVSIDEISYIDFPDLKINDNESTQMPFRYVRNEGGYPIMPEGMIDLIAKDSKKSFDNAQ